MYQDSIFIGGTLAALQPSQPTREIFMSASEYSRYVARSLFSMDMGQTADDASELLLTLADVIDEAHDVDYQDIEAVAAVLEKLKDLSAHTEQTFDEGVWGTAMGNWF